MSSSDIASSLVTTVMSIYDIEKHGLNEPNWSVNGILAIELTKIWYTGLSHVGLSDVCLASFLKIELNHLFGEFKYFP